MTQKTKFTGIDQFYRNNDKILPKIPHGDIPQRSISVLNTLPLRIYPHLLPSFTSLISFPSCTFFPHLLPLLYFLPPCTFSHKFLLQSWILKTLNTCIRVTETHFSVTVDFFQKVTFIYALIFLNWDFGKLHSR